MYVFVVLACRCVCSCFTGSLRGVKSPTLGWVAQIAVLEPAFDQRRSDCGYELYCTHLPSQLGNLSRTLNRHQRMRSRSAIPEYACGGGGLGGRGSGGAWRSEDLGLSPCGSPKHGPNQFHHSPGRFSRGLHRGGTARRRR